MFKIKTDKKKNIIDPQEDHPGKDQAAFSGGKIGREKISIPPNVHYLGVFGTKKSVDNSRSERNFCESLYKYMYI